MPQQVYKAQLPELRYTLSFRKYEKRIGRRWSNTLAVASSPIFFLVVEARQHHPGTRNLAMLCLIRSEVMTNRGVDVHGMLKMRTFAAYSWP